MTTTTTTTTTPDRTVSIRLRLTPRECASLERVRVFLGLPSLSSAAHRLALWNARSLAAALDTDTTPDAFVDAVGDNLGDIARLAVRQAIREAGR